MKFTWEEHDLRPALGTIVEKPGAGEWWILGYNAAAPHIITLTSLRDGMTNILGGIESALRHLNESGMRPIVDRVRLNGSDQRHPPRLGDPPKN